MSTIRRQRIATILKNANAPVLLLGVVVVIAALLYGAYWLLVSRYHESTDDAYAAGNLVQITSQVAGTVISIGADETDSVHQGDVLVALNPADANIALERAQADLGEAVRQVQKLFFSTRQYEAGVLWAKPDCNAHRTICSDAMVWIRPVLYRVKISQHSRKRK